MRAGPDPWTVCGVAPDPWTFDRNVGRSDTAAGFDEPLRPSCDTKVPPPTTKKKAPVHLWTGA